MTYATQYNTATHLQYPIQPVMASSQPAVASLASLASSNTAATAVATGIQLQPASQPAILANGQIPVNGYSDIILLLMSNVCVCV